MGMNSPNMAYCIKYYRRSKISATCINKQMPKNQTNKKANLSDSSAHKITKKSKA
jgi:hypothetical protein